MTPRDAVAITGMGAVSSLGGDCAALWSGIAEGRSGIGTIERFPTHDFDVHTGATASCDAAVADAGQRSLCLDFSRRAAAEALASAGVSAASCGERLALVFGTGLADRSQLVHEMVETLASDLAIAGPVTCVSTACSSSTGAIGIGRDLLLMGAADVVVAGGADVLTPEVFAGFHALGVLTPGRCAPFSTPSGTTLGEGAGFVVLERLGNARSRGARVRAVLAGYGLSGDAWHETSPDPKGAGIARAIRAAVLDAGVEPECIEYVNAHGSGTQANDSAEWLGISHALGAPGRALPVSSTKGALGHAQGAAGVLEAIATIEAMERGFIPPTANFAGARPHAPPDPVPGPRPREGACSHVVSVNAAFGGANAAIVLSRAPTARVVRRRRLVLRGAGFVTPAGTSASRPPARCDGRVNDLSLESYVPGADVRRLDRSAQFLTAAAAIALQDARITVSGSRRDTTGLLVGQLRASPASLDEFMASVDRGLTQVSAPAFARIVLNAASGTCSKLLSLRGPLSTITTGEGSGLAAVILAAEHLAWRTDARLMVAGGVDELADVEEWMTPAGMEGAACVVLEAPGDEDEGDVEVAGWGLAATGSIHRAMELATADDDGASPRRYDAGTACGGAAGAVMLLAEAADDVRQGRVASALVTGSEGSSVACAILLRAGRPT